MAIAEPFRNHGCDFFVKFIEIFLSMNITFIGTGYVGLVSGIMLSYFGHNVTCLDTDKTKISKLKQGLLPIHEPGLEQYLAICTKEGRLNFADAYSQELQNSSAIFITVGTPSSPSGEADLKYVFEAIDNVSKWASVGCLIIIKSTVPLGTCNLIREYLETKNYKFHIAANPEFLREGCAVEDFLHPDRIIIGTNDEQSRKLLEEIYWSLTSQNVPLVNTDVSTAELIKYGSNAFLAIKIAFINEMANLCEKSGADIKKLSQGIGLDSRIGQKFLKAGPGFGGSCFPKDILALSHIAKKYQSVCRVLDAAIEANGERASDMVKKISEAIGGNLHDKNLAILGLAFKAGTDDVRSSSAIEIIKILQSQGANITAYDPVAITNALMLLPELQYANSAMNACNNADAVVIITEWPEFEQLDIDRLHAIMKSPTIIDLRNILNPEVVIQKGFKYYCIGGYMSALAKS